MRMRPQAHLHSVSDKTCIQRHTRSAIPSVRDKSLNAYQTKLHSISDKMRCTKHSMYLEQPGARVLVHRQIQVEQLEAGRHNTFKHRSLHSFIHSFTFEYVLGPSRTIRLVNSCKSKHAARVCLWGGP